MNISANNISLHIANSSPVKQNAGGASVSPVNSVATTNVTATAIPQASIADTVSQSPVVGNPTYARPVNNQVSNVPPESVNQSENGQQSNPSNNVQQQEEPEAEETTEQKTTQEAADDSENKEQFTELELKQISNLQSRDSEVITHERAHSAVGGQYSGSPSYSYETGPDGIKYAVSGEVSIDTSKVPNDPQATLQKAQQIKAAALAPAEPSAQDRHVAAKAEQMATQARSEILQENHGDSEDKPAGSSISYESSEPEHFSGTQRLAKDDDQQQMLNNRINQINMVYQNSSTTKSLSSFQTQI